MAALVDGTTYVTSAEYENGFAEIAGEIVSLRERVVDVRVRHTVPRAIFVASKYHDAARTGNDYRTKEIIRRAVSGLLGDDELLVYAEVIGEHIYPDVLDGL